MNDVTLKEYIAEQIQSLRREMAIQREADLIAQKLARDAIAARLETTRWTVGIIVTVLILAAAVAALWRHV